MAKVKMMYRVAYCLEDGCNCDMAGYCHGCRYKNKMHMEEDECCDRVHWGGENVLITTTKSFKYEPPVAYYDTAFPLVKIGRKTYGLGTKIEKLWLDDGLIYSNPDRKDEEQ